MFPNGTAFRDHLSTSRNNIFYHDEDEGSSASNRALDTNQIARRRSPSPYLHRPQSPSQSASGRRRRASSPTRVPSSPEDSSEELLDNSFSDYNGRILPPKPSRIAFSNSPQIQPTINPLADGIWNSAHILHSTLASLTRRSLGSQPQSHGQQQVYPGYNRIYAASKSLEDRLLLCDVDEGEFHKKVMTRALEVISQGAQVRQRAETWGTEVRGMPIPFRISPWLDGQQMQTPLDRPFKCDQCVHTFSRDHDLKRHRRIHLAIKPFPCTSCNKTFSRKDALKRHQFVRGCEMKPNEGGESDSPVVYTTHRKPGPDGEAADDPSADLSWFLEPNNKGLHTITSRRNAFSLRQRKQQNFTPYTISKDCTAGEEQRVDGLLAEFGRKSMRPLLLKSSFGNFNGRISPPIPSEPHDPPAGA